MLTDLIAMSRSGDAIPPNFGAECRAALEQILGQFGVVRSQKLTTGGASRF